MKKVFTVLTLLAMVLTTWAAPALADDDDIEDAIEDGDAGIRLLTRQTAAVTRGDDVWVMINWTAFGKAIDGVDDFEVTLRKNPPRGVTVEYPENTVDHTSLWDNRTLSVGEVDYTALHVVVDSTYRSSEARVQLNVNFTVNGERFRERYSVTVPVVTFEGDPVEQVTDDLGTSSGQPAWFEIAYAGQAPSVSDFAVVVDGPAGLDVTYPQGDFTSLHFDDVLESRETDVVRLYLDTTGVSPGTHVIDVKCTYVYNGRSVSEADTVTLTVTAP